VIGKVGCRILSQHHFRFVYRYWVVVINTSIFVNIVVIRELWNFRLRYRIQHWLHLVSARPCQLLLAIDCGRCHLLQQWVLVNYRTIKVLKFELFGYRLGLILLLSSDGWGPVGVQKVRVLLGLLHIQVLLLPLRIHRVGYRRELSGRVLCHETRLPYHYLILRDVIDASSNQILCRLRMLVIDLSHVLVKYSALILCTHTDSLPHCIRCLFCHCIR